MCHRPCHKPHNGTFTGLTDLAGEAHRFGAVGRTAGQGQEDVVESGAVHGEPLHRAAVRVNLIQQGSHVRGGSGCRAR